MSYFFDGGHIYSTTFGFIDTALHWLRSGSCATGAAIMIMLKTRIKHDINSKAKGKGKVKII
jgi:hypothetical protein